MKYNFCLPIIENSKQAVLNEISQYSKEYRYLEIWLDYISDIEPNFVSELINLYNDRLLFLFRRQNFERTLLNMQLKQDIIKIISASTSYLDLDINNQIEELEYLKTKKINLNLICSYHNYEQTPDSQELSAIFQKMQTHAPQIYKFSCHCKHEKDAVRLLSLLFEIQQFGAKHIVLGMGGKALVTRIFASIWGNEMIFAPPLIEKSSAPGQLTIDQFKNILSSLE